MRAGVARTAIGSVLLVDDLDVLLDDAMTAAHVLIWN